jgi:hypothetical protein
VSAGGSAGLGIGTADTGVAALTNFVPGAFVQATQTAEDGSVGPAQFVDPAPPPPPPPPPPPDSGTPPPGGTAPPPGGTTPPPGGTTPWPRRCGR